MVCSSRKPTDVKGGGGSGARYGVYASALSGSKAGATPQQQQSSAFSSKRKALQHGRPQLAGAGQGKSQGAIASVEPPPAQKIDEPVAHGRVTAVPGLLLAQPSMKRAQRAEQEVEHAAPGARVSIAGEAVRLVLGRCRGVEGGVCVPDVSHPSMPGAQVHCSLESLTPHTPTKLSEGIGSKAAAWRAAHVAAVEKPLPVQFAGAGGGRASDEVLAMTSPNLVGAFSQVRRCLVRACVRRQVEQFACPTSRLAAQVRARVDSLRA